MTRFSTRTVIAAFTDVSFGEACHVVNLYRHMTDSYIKAAELPFVRNKIRAELQNQHPWFGYFRYEGRPITQVERNVVDCIKRHGYTLSVKRLPEEERRHKSPEILFVTEVPHDETTRYSEAGESHP